MDAPLDELYFQWLYNQIGGSKSENPNRTYWRMLRTLYCKEFVWIVPNDDNRIADGKDLRYEFVDQSGLNDVDLGWIQLPCSMLELLIGLSRRLSFEAEGEPRDWFWHMIENLRLLVYKDSKPWPEQSVHDILDRVIWRTYEPSGHGGIFPLSYAQEDQRKVELWYQMCAYILERP
jgi:hypothetical protein